MFGSRISASSSASSEARRTPLLRARLGTLAALLLAAGLFPACGSGGSSSAFAGLQITVVDPEVLYSHSSGAVRVLGHGFGQRRTKVTLRFHALAGTPFMGGTSSTFDVEATVDSDEQARGTVPPTFVTSSFSTSVSVILANGDLFEGAAGPDFVAQAIFGFTPTEATSGATPAFVLTGQGFQPPLGLVTLRFRAVSGSPFAAGASDTVLAIGTVTSPTTIEGFMPDSDAAFEADASVEVIFADGGVIVSPGPVIHFFPIPKILGFQPGFLPGGTVTNTTITGTAFGPVGGAAIITLIATSGTPFSGGLASEFSYQVDVDSPISMSGLMPDHEAITDGFAFVRATFVGGVVVESAFPLAAFGPAPTIDSITPDVFESGSRNPWRIELGADPQPFTLGGTRFGAGGTVNLTFTATAGTPFNNGTAATFQVVASVLNSTTMAGTMNDPQVASEVTATISAVFPNGSSAVSPPGILTIGPVPEFQGPFYDFDALNSQSIVNLSDDTSLNVPFPAGFSFPFYGSTITGGNAHIVDNGALNFNGADATFSPPIDIMVNGPMSVAGHWGDLYPEGGGTFYWDDSTYSDRVVATFDNITSFGGGGGVEFQIVLYDLGRIDILWGFGHNDTFGFAGIGPGNGAGATNQIVNFLNTAFPDCDNSSPTDAPTQNETSSMGGTWVVFYPDGSDGYDWASGPH